MSKTICNDVSRVHEVKKVATVVVRVMQSSNEVFML